MIRLRISSDIFRSGYFFLGSLPRDGDPIKLNGAIHVTCTILKLVAASAAEAELGALFLNAQEAKVIRLVLAELGHPQPPTPIHIDNTTTVGIVNNTIKRQRSRSMEMRYFWLLDGATQQYFKFYNKGVEKLPGEAFNGKLLLTWLIQAQDKANMFTWTSILTIKGKPLT